MDNRRPPRTSSITRKRSALVNRIVETSMPSISRELGFRSTLFACVICAAVCGGCVFDLEEVETVPTGGHGDGGIEADPSRFKT
jgi:hypothetical protein